MSMEYNELHKGAHERGSFISRLFNIFTEMKIESILRVYRLASFTLSAALFLLFPGDFPLTFQLTLLFLLMAISALMVLLYEHYWKYSKVMTLLILAELLGISLLLAYTGGFNGPFLWYALNPFIITTAFFTFPVSWLYLFVLLAGTFSWKTYLYGGTLSITEIISTNYYQTINLVVIVMIMHLFARMHINLAEQSQEKKSQRMELLSAYQSLSSNYEVFQGLSNFQREVVSYKNTKDIYTTLIDTLTNIFPFRKACVLVPQNNIDIRKNKNLQTLKMLCSTQGEALSSIDSIIEEIDERWDELARLGTKKVLIGRNRSWVALPLHGEKKSIKAVFVGWISTKVNPLSFAENLSLFIKFAEQTTEWLSMFRQKERVLQHISSIYEAVEAASSQNNPRQVIDLFASYARALTDCDKTIFWMENVSSTDKDDYHPIFSVKGPHDYYPEEEWRSSLLQVWSTVHDDKIPVEMELNSNGSNPARLICVPVRSGEQCLGMLAGIHSKNTYSTNEVKQTLSVLADLGAIAVERSRADMFAEKLMIVDEQKRIANEIHDSISQNLFSIVYSIDTLAKQVGGSLRQDYREMLQDIKSLSAETARELRALIYRLNPRENVNDSFVEQTKTYLEKLGRMNGIEINYSFEGSTEYLNPAICKVLFRILKESTGNALRHGKCNEIIVHLDITPFYSLLNVSDNGKGFDVQSSLDLYSSGNRLGLVNMRELAIALQGNLKINSKPGRGTEVICHIPTSPVSVQ